MRRGVSADIHIKIMCLTLLRSLRQY